MKYTQQIYEQHEKDIADLKGHAQIANHEMGFIKQDMSVVKTDIGWIKEMISKVDARGWFILSGVILAILIQILVAIYPHK